MTTPADVQQQHHDALVQEGKRKYSSYLEDHVLDYLHNNPIHIEACLSTCTKIFRNVVDNPGEEKFRRVKATSATLRNAVANVKGGEDLLLHAGWTPKVVEMEKFWVFDAAPDSVRFGVLAESLHLTERALHTVHEKAEKKRLEKEAKLSRDAAEKERVRLAIEEDKLERKLRAGLTAPHAEGPASPTATARGAGTAPAAAPAAAAGGSPVAAAAAARAARRSVDGEGLPLAAPQ